ncbi:hypothetical protein E9529_09950 [Blastococcus sp. KM273128]|uniref:LGFP repeat-containing protein n=1 Tax=Blastococcus sp. KM273128 TaxID=2570314 RepID=UPI0027E05129|nr:hypothetical protein [Blastococcus sp. KM273128]MCF6744598.1 hypothetical protein [Blastococcus sp. KM273128]
MRCGLKDGGCYQVFQGGALYWSPATGAKAVSGFLWSRWASLGYEGGWLGYPAGDVRCGLKDGGCYQLYQGGALYWSPATGAKAVSGYLWDRWAAMGYEGGRLGYPTTDVTCGLRGGGCYQIYQGGGVYWSGASGAWIVEGSLWGRWAALGYEAGSLGYPVSDVVCLRDRPGCYQRFQGGTLHT